MTREEAIAILNHKVSACLHGTKWGEALDIAIKALEQEPCEEAISRQAALDALEWKWAGKAAIDAIKDLPPVTPHPKYEEDIAKAFQFGLAFGFGKKHDEMDRVIDEIKKVITPLPKGHRWIPVSERLPEKGEYGKVLVTYIPSGGTLWTTVMIAHYSDLMGIAKPCFHIGEVGKESFQKITKQVIAWMSLPEPYVPDINDGKMAESEG